MVRGCSLTFYEWVETTPVALSRICFFLKSPDDIFQLQTFGFHVILLSLQGHVGLFLLQGLELLLPSHLGTNDVRLGEGVPSLALSLLCCSPCSRLLSPGWPCSFTACPWLPVGTSPPLRCLAHSRTASDLCLSSAHCRGVSW